MTYRVLLLTFTFLFIGSAFAEPLKVTGTHFNKIYEFDNKTKKFNGVAVDIIDLVATKLGLKFQYDIVPWNRAQNSIAMGLADIIVGPYRTEERETKMDFIPVPFYTDRMVFYTLRSKPFEWKNNFEDLKSKKIVTIRGWTYGKQFDEAIEKLEHFEANDIESAFNLLKIGRAEILVANERNSQEVLEMENYRNQFSKTKLPLSFMSGYFAFSTKNKDKKIRKLIEQELLRLYQSGEIEKINKNYNLTFDK